MKILRIMFIVSMAAILLLSGCNPPTGTTPGSTVTSSDAPATDAPTPEVTPTTSVDPRPTVDSDTSTLVQQSYPWDYTQMWWPEGYTGTLKEIYASTGIYGLALNAVTGYISRFGVLDAPDRDERMSIANSDIKKLPGFTMRYTLSYDDVTLKMNYVTPSEDDVSLRMLETGSLLQRMDVMYLKAKDNDDVYGRMEVTVLPEYFAINYEVFPDGMRIDDATLSISLSIDSIYKDVTVSSDSKTAVLRSADGSGYSLVIPKDVDATLTRENSNIIVSCKVNKLARNKFNGFGFIVIPSENASQADAEAFRKRDEVKVTASQISPNERTQKVTYDADHGMYSIDVNKAFSNTEGQFSEDNLNTYEKVRFSITNPTDTTVRVPIQFIKDRPLAVTGPSPMLLDPETGEPTGHQLQITRNWHFYDTSTPSDSPRRYWEGQWYHCYTMIEVPAGQTVTYDFCVSYAQWGGIESVVHSQLCLAGWGGQKIWESCSLGAYGESFCYDVGRGYTWCTMGDICAFGLYSRIDGKKYNWTTNTGGADFMGVYDTANYQLKVNDLRIQYKNHGPNLSEVIYKGKLGNKIAFEAVARTPRTNDISMAYQTFTYTFLEDTRFNRMYFYQIGADSYNYDYWSKMAVGNNSGIIDFDYNGKHYSGEFATPQVEGYPDYVGHKGCNPVQVPGEGAWFAFLGAPKGESKGNKAISIKEYKASINGKEYTQPSFSIRTTHVLDWKSAGFEINPPAEAGNVIKAGSTVSFTVHYYNLPAHKSDYYGKGEYLNQLSAAKYDTWELAYEYALRNNISIAATVGELQRLNTPLVRSSGEKNGVVAQFTITGGIGYVPVTISNVKGYSGWRLEQKVNGEWKPLDQGVHGNDYWQAYYCIDGTYELTFNVPASIDRFGTEEFRLVK